MSSMSSVPTPTAEDFRRFSGEEFQLSAGEGEPILATAVLRDVTISKWGKEDGQPGFSLIFTGPARPALPQGLFRLSDGVMGNLDVFLVPISGDSEKREYQAVFN